VIAVDTETTGVDFYHGAMPFFVTTCDEEGEQTFWEWEVDPLTRKPLIPEFDRTEGVGSVLFTGESDLVGQNIKFDVAALRTILDFSDWPWDRTHDTLLAAHLLASNRPKDLTSLVLMYLGEDIEPYEKALEEVVQKARRVARREFPTWRIARKDDPSMPSAKDRTWKYDCWLPRALLKAGYEPEESEHDWATVLRDYSNTDSAYTLAVWKVMEAEMERRGLREFYEERRKLPRIVHGMERRGLTGSKQRLERNYKVYREESKERARICVSIAASKGYELELPKGAVNNSLRKCIYEVLKIPPVYVGVSKTKKTNNPTLDSKNAIPYYLDTLPANSRERLFIKALSEKRARDTALAYMEGYRSFWLLNGDGDTFVLHPSLNMTGTDTLRFSSSSPNEQNISKREGFNLRVCFGPAPGREWWSLDAKNIELRIPAYEAEEEEMIALFERPDDPPYYGSNHLLIAHTLWPAEFEACRGEDGGLDGRIFKKKYAATLYQWTKNGNFAVQYGAIERKGMMGTADRAYHQQGAQAKVKARLRKSAALNDKYIQFAMKNGYVETLPDRTVNPSKGYPLLCTRTDEGRIMPTVPLNFHVQGTAMWWTARAMVKVQEQLDKWRSETGFDGHITMQVHDEIVVDLPFKEEKGNLPRIRVIQKLMESCGRDLIPAIPTPVGCEYHPVSWDEGITL
jgi:DNA polymerase I-like protein with 3'-5' exonuclease and polymerase domains